MDGIVTSLDHVLAFTGITIFSATKFNSRPWLIFQWINFIIGFVVFIFVSIFVIVSNKDIVIWIEGACIWTTAVIMIISLAVCLIFREDFRTFLEDMVFRDGILQMPLAKMVLETEKVGILNELRTMIMNSREIMMKRLRILLRAYVCGVWLCAVLYVGDSIREIVMSEDKTLRIFAFNMWVPWSLENFYVYIISFIFDTYGGCLCCIIYPGLQTTIMLLNSEVIRQYRILSFILLHLDGIVMEFVSEKNSKWQSICTLILGQCVEHWVKIKRFSDKVNAICKYFYLTLILVAIMLVCLCSVKIAISDKMSTETAKYYIHEICFISMVLMFCYLGQLVQNECAYLEEVIMEKWYIYNKCHRVNVKIFHMALSHQRPIYIFGTIPLTLPTFTWFIKTGMSFFTLVMSVLQKHE